MIRHLLSLLVAGLLCAAIGAQNPTTLTLTSTQRVELFKKNRPLIERLVEKTVESSQATNDHLKRADTYYKVLFDFSKELSAAKAANDNERVDELTRHLKQLLDNGLAPTLLDARRQVEHGTGNEDYERVKKGLLAQVGALLEAMDDRPETRKSLEDTKAKLHTIVGPKKK